MRAPTYVSQTATPRAASQAFRAHNYGGGLAGGIARGLQAGGQALSQFAQAEDQIQAKHDDQFSRKQSVEYRREAAEIMAEFNQLEGAAAIEAAQATKTRLQELRKRYSDQNGNSRMKRFFDERTEEFALQAESSVVERSIGQQRIMDLGLNDAERLEAVNRASTSWGDIEQHTFDMADVRALAGEAAELKGLTGEARTQYVRAQVSSARRAAIADMLTDDAFSTSDAIGYLARHEGDFVMSDRVAIQESLQGPIRERWGAEQFHDIVSGFSPSSPSATGSGSEAASLTAAPSSPVEATRVSSNYGPRKHPVSGENHFHHGVDFAAPAGSSITSVADGIVTRSFFDEKGGGWVVSVLHGDGHEASYLHMQGQSQMNVGDRVTRGDVLGTVGSTGSSTGPHLDFRVSNGRREDGGEWINPEEYLEGSVPIGSPDSPRAWDSEAIMGEIDRREAEGAYSFEQAEFMRGVASRRISRDRSLIADREQQAGRDFSEWLLQNRDTYTDPTKIPRDIWGRMSPSARLQADEIAARNKDALAGGVKANGPMAIQLDLLRIYEPEEFMELNLGEYIGQVSNGEISTLMAQQAKAREEQAEGVRSWSPRTGITTAFNYQRRLDGADYNDNEERAVLVMMEDIAQRMYLENGQKPLTDADYAAAYREATRDINVTYDILGIPYSTGIEGAFERDHLVEGADLRREARDRYREVNGRFPDPEDLPSLVRALRREKGQ